MVSSPLRAARAFSALFALALCAGLAPSAHAQPGGRAGGAARNLALGKPASQSASPYGGTGTAAAALDGNTNGVWDAGSVSHTDEHSPWWQVDLGGSFDIARIRIYNRTDCCRERLRGFYILVSDMPWQGVPASGPVFGGGPHAFGGEDFRDFTSSTNTRGRYVRIALDHDDYLSLAEVEVYGRPARESAVQVKGDNVGRVGYAENGNGSFEQTGPGRWHETNRDGQHDFREAGRDEWSVYLRDDARGMGVQLDLFRKMVSYQPDGGQKTDLYAITSAGPAPAFSAPPAPVTDLGGGNSGSSNTGGGTVAAPAGDIPIDQVQVPADAALEKVPYMAPGDLDKVLDWIEKKAIGAKLPFCWRDSYGDVGKAVSECPPGTIPDPSGGPLSLCYPPCQDGYEDVSFVCWQRCPPGFRNDGGFCRKPDEYSRGAGRVPDVTCPPGFSQRGIGAAAWCDNGPRADFWNLETRAATIGCRGDEEMSGALCYPRCRAGYHQAAGFMCTADCPPGFGDDIGVSCTKKTYTRTAGSPRQCGPGMEQDGPLGLCYPPSRAGFHRVGPVYWQNCDEGWTDCGAGCQKNSDPILGIDAPWRDCASTISDQVSSVVMLAVNIGTLGLAAPETAALKAGEETVKISGKVVTGASKGGKALVKIKNLYDRVKPSTLAKNYKVVRMIYNPRTKMAIQAMKTTYDVASTVYEAQNTYRSTFSEDFVEQTSPEIAARIDAEFPADVAAHIKRSWADVQLARLASTEGWEAAETALTVVSLVDPTGVVGVVSAFAKPVCQPLMPFPTLAGSYK